GLPKVNPLAGRERLGIHHQQRIANGLIPHAVAHQRAIVRAPHLLPEAQNRRGRRRGRRRRRPGRAPGRPQPSTHRQRHAEHPRSQPTSNKPTPPSHYHPPSLPPNHAAHAPPTKDHPWPTASHNSKPSSPASRTTHSACTAWRWSTPRKANSIGL